MSQIQQEKENVSDNKSDFLAPSTSSEAEQLRDRLCEWGLFSLDTIFTEWLIRVNEEIVGYYSITYPSGEEVLSSPAVCEATALLQDFCTNLANSPLGPGFSETAFHLKLSTQGKGLGKAIKKKVLEEIIRPHINQHPIKPIFKDGSFTEEPTQNAFNGIWGSIAIANYPSLRVNEQVGYLPCCWEGKEIYVRYPCPLPLPGELIQSLLKISKFLFSKKNKGDPCDDQDALKELEPDLEGIVKVHPPLEPAMWLLSQIRN